MNKFKFRIFDKREKEMIYFDFSDVKYSLSEIDSKLYSYDFYENDIPDIMQIIPNVLDKNSKEIYEDDIIKGFIYYDELQELKGMCENKIYFVGIAKFNENGFFIETINIFFDEKGLKNTIEDIFDIIFYSDLYTDDFKTAASSNFEVMGNTRENKNLWSIL